MLKILNNLHIEDWVVRNDGVDVEAGPEVGEVSVKVRRGDWVLLDNINSAPPEVVERLNSITESEPGSAVQESTREVAELKASEQAEEGGGGNVSLLA